MYAYNEMYLDDAMENLAQMIDFAVNQCGDSLEHFLERFCIAPLSYDFERGNPKYVAGMSGIELAYEVYDMTGEPIGEVTITPSMDRSPEYWCGWVLAYYQWRTKKSFREILKGVSAKELLGMYGTLHEADIKKFAEVMDKKLEEKSKVSRLQMARRNAGLSQSELSRKSGVSLRSVQMYEQRKKDINKARAESVANLARALGCQIEDILE